MEIGTVKVWVCRCDGKGNFYRIVESHCDNMKSAGCRCSIGPNDDHDHVIVEMMSDQFDQYFGPGLGLKIGKKILMEWNLPLADDEVGTTPIEKGGAS